MNWSLETEPERTKKVPRRDNHTWRGQRKVPRSLLWEPKSTHWKHLIVSSSRKIPASLVDAQHEYASAAARSSCAHAWYLPGHRPHCPCHTAAHGGSKDQHPLDSTWLLQDNRPGASEESRLTNNHPWYWAYRIGFFTYYPGKPNGSLCVCLDSCDLNTAIIREHFKAQH